ncbi:MAG: helix-turn-helix domain-containing protein [Desulfobacterales bacterium]|jgi:transcriptional regulator with XRE-family HTH domain|nr:helix-turn-helix domain-containing protein [Desulfobacterales bacterium]
MKTNDAETFGEMLRTRRLEAGMGLRELAASVQISPGYLSDIEQGNVGPPKAKVILSIARALNIDKALLLSSARKLDPDLSSYISEKPGAADFLRMAKDKGFEDDDWERLCKMIELTRLGKGEK